MNHSRRIAYLCGQVGLMSLVRFLFSWNLKYADQVSTDGQLLFEASMIGLAFLAFRVFDGITDPWAGVLSDRWVHRGKQRRTLLWFFFAIPAFGLVAFFVPTHTMAASLRWTLIIGGLTVFFVGYTFYAIPYWSLSSDYADNDPGERRVLSTLLGAGMLIATALVALVSPGLVTSYGYFHASIIFACIGAVLMAMPYFAQPRQKPSEDIALTAEPSADKRTPERKEEPMIALLRRALSHRRFLAVLLLFCGSQMAFTVITSAAPFITERLLGGTDADVARIMGPFLAAALPTFVLVPWISRRWGWQRAIVVASVALGVVYIGTAGLGGAWIGTPMTTAMVLFACAGPMAGIILGLEAEAINACADEAGGESTSLYFGVFNFLVKALNGVAMFLTGLLVTLARDPAWQTMAIRIMPMMAGGLLILGGAAYAIARPSERPVDDPV